MKKIMLSILIICMVVSFSGCSIKNLGNTSFLKSEGEKIAKEDIQQIIAAIENEDADSIKSMMADKALYDDMMQGNDIDNQIQNLFEFYQGKMQTCEYKSGRESIRHGDEGDYGERIKRMATGSYIVTTDQDTYILYVYHNVDGVIEEEEGVYCINIMKYNDYNNLNLWDYFSEANAECGIHVTDMSVMEDLEKQLRYKGDTGFDAVISGYAMTTESYCEDYNAGNTQLVDKYIEIFSNEVEINKQDVEKMFRKLNFNTGDITDIIDSGFNDNERLMYCEGIVGITDIDQDECPVKYRIKMKWQKCADDSKSGLTYFALMSEEDYQAGREFTEGEGLFVIE